MDFGDPTKLHYGKQVAAALAFIGLVNHDRVVLDTFSTGLDGGLPSIRGRSQMWRVVQYLDQLQASGASNLTAAAKAFAIKHAGKGIVVVISDFLDKRGYQDALRYLAGPEHGHLRHPRPVAARRSSPSSSATSAWSMPRTTTSPRSPSAPRS